MKTAGLLDAAVMAVPGLAFLAGTVVLPGALLTGLTSAVLAVTVSAVIGYVLTHRAEIAAWPARVAGRRIGIAAVLAVGLLIGYVLAYATVVADYAWPPGTDASTELLVPATVGDGGLAFPYVDCTQSFEDPCLPDTPGSERKAAASAQGLADRIAVQGPGAYAIPRGGAWYLWVAALVGGHAATGGVLVVLFGLLRLRGVDVASFLKEPGAAGDAPPPAEAASDAPPEAAPTAAPEADHPPTS